MKDRPILFNGEMVRAILEGRKTQTRRIVKPRPKYLGFFGQPTWKWCPRKGISVQSPNALSLASQMLSHHNPYRNVFKLWVRETWGMGAQFDSCKPSSILDEMKLGKHPEVTYRADNSSLDFHRWRPSIFMPRWASRITLEVTSVGVERVQDISERDILAEGITTGHPHDQFEKPVDPRRRDSQLRLANFKALWDAINAKRGYSWEQNPWVWVVEFKLEQSSPETGQERSPRQRES